MTGTTLSMHTAPARPAGSDVAMLEADVARASRETPSSSLTVNPMDDYLLDAAIRLLRLLDSPDDIPILAPLAEKEILYRLLRGEQADCIRRKQAAAGQSGDHLDQAQLPRVYHDRNGRVGSADDCLGIASALQGRHRYEPATISEAVAAAGSATSHVIRGRRRCDGQPCCRLGHRGISCLEGWASTPTILSDGRPSP